MKTSMKIITAIFILLVLALIPFTACSDSSVDNVDTDTNSYTINATENKDVPLGAEMVSSSTEKAQVKLTRDIEADIVNVYVISGSVKVTDSE